MEKSCTQLADELEAMKAECELMRKKCEATEAELLKRIQTEQQLRERFETIFHQSNVAHKIINRDLEIIEINQAVADLLGYTPKELLGTKIRDYTHPDFKEHWHNLQVALWKKQVDQFQLEACLVRKDGTEAWVIVHTILFKDQGEEFGYSLLEDITSRKLLERHKDEFITTISHELKTPMTALKAQCQLMVRHLRRYEDGHADKMMSGIDKQTNRLTRFINNLVLVSKIETGKLEPEMIEYRLDGLVSDVIDEIRLSAPQRTFHLELQDELLIKGDPDKIYQVVYNLLSNALKFSAHGTPVEVVVERQQEWGVVCVKDQGQGIGEENLGKIFERFFKVDTLSSSVESGVGLGLFISSEIVQHQNGRLWVDSEPGKGSTFCFRLPVLDV